MVEGEEVCCLHALFGFSHSYRTITPFTPKTICVCVCVVPPSRTYKCWRWSRPLGPALQHTTLHTQTWNVKHTTLPKFKKGLFPCTQKDYFSMSISPPSAVSKSISENLRRDTVMRSWGPYWTIHSRPSSAVLSQHNHVWASVSRIGSS